MKKHVILVLAMVSVASLLLMALNNNMKDTNKKFNGFQRRIIEKFAQADITVKNEWRLKGIGGFTGTSIYFTTGIPGQVVETDYHLNQIAVFDLQLPHMEKLIPVYYTGISYPDIYILGGNRKELLAGNLQTRKWSARKIKSGVFKNGLFMYPDAFVLQDFDSTTNNSLLKKVNMEGNIAAAAKISFIKGAIDFKYDGKLSYDIVENRLVYVCYYCNKIAVFDTGLKERVIFYSLDTFSTPKVTLQKSGQSVTHAAPPTMVNKSSCAYNGVLYVHSAIKADNEKLSDFKNRFTIDMFNLNTGKYLGSFYLPLEAGKKISHFKVVYGNKLIALNNSEVVTYRLKSLLQ